MQRALSFQYLLEHKTICIQPGELIVGEKGPAPKASPTYPELCCHTLSDLDILDSRPKIPFKVEPLTRRTYAEEIIPAWEGRSMRELIFREMTPQWQDGLSKPGFSPSSWNSAPPGTPSWTTKSTAWG